MFDQAHLREQAIAKGREKYVQVGLLKSQIIIHSENNHKKML